MKQQRGFTMIELIVVIIILGILAVTAMPRFLNLSDDAAKAATEGVAGALSSAGVINLANASLRGVDSTVPNSGIAMTDPATICSNATWTGNANTLIQGGMPAGYTVTVSANNQTTACTAGGAVRCTVTRDVGGATAEAFIPCTGAPAP